MEKDIQKRWWKCLQTEMPNLAEGITQVLLKHICNL